jgi:prepilin-type N-terminal cleavage/methylation domain-containing protein
MQWNARTTSHRAFTLLEMLAVVLIVTIVALVASPSRSVANALRRTASEEHLLQVLHTARAQAMAQGRPFGVQLDRYLNTSLMLIETTGATPTQAASIAGESSRDVASPAASGTDLSSISVNGSSVTSTTIWFSELGVPHTRNAAGASPVNLSSDALAVFSGGRTLRIRAVTGGVNLE